MDRAPSPPARIIAALIAIAGLGTVAAQVAINLPREPSALIAFAHIMRFFTLWTNCGGALLFAWLASGRGISARVLWALASAYTVVALVYHLLLAATHHPVGADWWTNLMFHTLLPLAAVGWWFAFAATPAWRDLPAVMVAPLVYTPFALAVGAATGFYPYFFLDQPRLGWPALVGWIAALAAAFLAIGAILRIVRGREKKMRRPE